MERWGMKGVNYIANLIQAGYAKEAALIISLPSHAKAVIVAEQNMGTVALNQDAIQAQVNAAAQDMQDPYMVKNAAKQANRQALYALRMELIGQGALGDQSGFEQEVVSAQAGLNESKATLNQAVNKEQTAINSLTKAQALFDQNPADNGATDALCEAIESAKEAADARGKAQKVLMSDQMALEEAQRNLAESRQQNMAKVDALAKQLLTEHNQQRAEIRAGLNEQAGVQAAEQENVPPDQMNPYNVSNEEKGEEKEGNPLVQVDEIDIIKESTQGEARSGAEDKGGLDGQTVEGTGRIITEIKYKPSSGAVLKATPGKTTTILGSYDKDMKTIVEELGNVKSTYVGPNDGGFNVLNIPDEIYKGMPK